jgi:hypothetical protein
MIRWIIFKFRDWIKDVNQQYAWIQHERFKTESNKIHRWAIIDRSPSNQQSSDVV